MEFIFSEQNWKDKINVVKNQFITHEKINQYAEEAWVKLKKETLNKLEDEQSNIRTYIDKELSKWVTSIQENANWQQKINGWK